jgi:hypothetical protein
LLRVAAVREERQMTTVGRPARAGVLLLAARELPRLAVAGGRGHPERRAVAVPLFVNGRDDIDDLAAVR